MALFPDFGGKYLRTAVLCGCLFLLAVLFSACAPATVTQLPPAPASPTIAFPTETATPLPVKLETVAPTASATPLPPDFWTSLPVIPDTVSERVRQIYRAGQEMGNNPRVFSRIGDCASAAPGFLVGFDRNYNLGEYGYLQPTIDYFKGSFGRPSYAARAGLNTSGVLSALWNPEQCQKNETLLDCQYRLDRPAFAIISFGTNEAYYVHRDPAVFERNMRVILEKTIAQGIVPVLATKADNVEGDNSINASIARLALEYEVPLWNFWLAVQPLPNQGMRDPEHLTSVSFVNFTDFTIPHSMEYGMQVRNLTALQMLDLLRRQLAEPVTPTATVHP